LSIVHPDAELAVARAARSTGAPVILSTVSSYTIEEVASALGETPRWFQLYPGKDDELMVSMVRRAEAAGYSALVVTVDTPILGWRERDLRRAYLPFLQGQGLANHLSDPVFRAGLAQPPEENPQAAILRFLDVFVNPAFTWDGVTFLRAQTALPILIKGITHPDDARLAVDRGVDGLIVSNHGGRQVDGAVAALDALPEVRTVAGDALAVLFDGGIRRGADVLKACALGADAVLLGRPYVYGLAVGGADGVAQVIRNLLADVDLELALSGYTALGDLDSTVVTAV
jgi:lactate 2-monooxygenase